LYAALGASRYAADTGTQFTLPDLRSRLPRGTATIAGAVVSNTNNTFTLNATSTSTNSGNHGHTNNAVNVDPASGGHNHTATTGTPSNVLSRGATGTAANVAAQGHTHDINAVTAFGVHTHVTNQGNANGAGDHGHSVNAPTLVGGLYIPAFVEVNYIIKI
jgi:microcystin-dependent protein